MHKVFGIGLGKTGTNTLSWMLRTLGWNTAHYMHDPSRYDEFDAVTDVPTHLYLLSTDLRYPNSKFILTTRNIDEWLVSWQWWDKNKPLNPLRSQMRLMCYGGEHYNKVKMQKLYERHCAYVRWYFQTYNPERLLELAICDKAIPDSEKWDKLCTFLGVPSPGIPIPQLNKRP